MILPFTDLKKPLAAGIVRSCSLACLLCLLGTGAFGAPIGAAGAAPAPASGEVTSLRLVPFPKKVTWAEGSFALDTARVLSGSGGTFELAQALIGEEMKRAGLPLPLARRLDGKGKAVLRLAAAEGGAMPEVGWPEAAKDESYALTVSPDGVTIRAETESGLFHGVQTLCQLIRANRRGNQLPCLNIQDWPSLRWRCFQDDLTRGPSTKLEVLKRQLDLGAFLKHNLFTYYMEHQYAWKKHPLLGPANGSLTPDELKALVAYGQSLHLDILGNQQSFGHFGNILKHKEYALLRETGDILCPVKEESYQLLDDLYAEVIPLLPCPFFNVCCDETYGLGEGPSKELVKQIGVGGVYARHLRRIHDLLKNNYHKRMMMWGDIILQHPEHLKEIPSDTILLIWGYDARASFEGQIVPFAKSGYEFFVCPGVNNWSRILPDFGVATTNIHHFVRDGAAHGTLGLLNTAWDDDGENFNAPSWHGYAWGAECAWNASTTSSEDFNRRLGAVLFGETGDHFGQAIEALAKTARLPGMQGMNNTRFWQLDLEPSRGNITNVVQLLVLVRPALAHLATCKKTATVNADLLDYFLFGAQRMELIGERLLGALEAAKFYQAAGGLPPAQARTKIEDAAAIMRRLRDTHEALGKRFAELWHLENKPYGLDWTIRRYDSAVAKYDTLIKRLTGACADATAGRSIPSPREIGLELGEPAVRSPRPR